MDEKVKIMKYKRIRRKMVLRTMDLMELIEEFEMILKENQ